MNATTLLVNARNPVISTRLLLKSDHDSDTPLLPAARS